MNRLRAVGAAAVLLVALAGCTGGGSTPDVSDRVAPAPGGSPSAAPVNVPADVEACPTSTGSSSADNGLPALTLDCLTGPGHVDLAALANGTPTIVNLWASWCGPCIKEMPVLQQAHAAYGEKVQVVGVLTKDPTDSWADTLTATGARYPSVRDDDGAVLATTRVPGLPVTLFVRGDGTIAFTKIAEVHDLAELQQLVADHLGVPA